jgi:hypothetical protein
MNDTFSSDAGVAHGEFVGDQQTPSIAISLKRRQPCQRHAVVALRHLHQTFEDNALLSWSAGLGLGALGDGGS